MDAGTLVCARDAYVHVHRVRDLCTDGWTSNSGTVPDGGNLIEKNVHLGSLKQKFEVVFTKNVNN